MKRSGVADLPLHNGNVPKWLYERMAKLGLAITETIIADYGQGEFLKRMSDPFWFQSFGAVMGMDWHSSGITTSVMGALKKALTPISKELGIYICGGKGKFSRQTPSELLQVGYATGLDGDRLGRFSRLSAKVDNTAVQDGFQLYLHNFIAGSEGEWTIVQQGMCEENGMARRYHWHSATMKSFVELPHTAVIGINKGEILNLTAIEAGSTKNGMLSITRENPEKMVRDIQSLILPAHHEVTAKDIDLKKLGAVLWMAHEASPGDFEELLLLKGVGPRTIQSLALVSEVVHGTPTRFRDPARFSFAHGGKDGHPFPVPTKTYDDVIEVMQKAIQKAKIDRADKSSAFKKLHTLTVMAEKEFIPSDYLPEVIKKEKQDSWKYGGKTVFGHANRVHSNKNIQLRLF